MGHETPESRIQSLQFELRQMMRERAEDAWLIDDLRTKLAQSKQRTKTLEDYHVLVVEALRRTHDSVYQAVHHLQQRELEKASLTLQQVLESLNFKKE